MKKPINKKFLFGGVPVGLLLLMLLCGAGPVLLLMFLGIFAAAVLLVADRIWPVQTVEPMQPVPPVRQPAGREAAVNDLQAMAWAVIQKQVAGLVCERFPSARWIWESPDARQKVCRGEPVFILLNRAGGYRCARVEIQNLQAVAVRYEEAAEKAASSEAEPVSEAAEENYELLAFEWVDAHAIELNARCNEAIGQKLLELVLLAEELPARESWPDICTELARAGLKDAKCVSEGIKINLTQ